MNERDELTYRQPMAVTELVVHTHDRLIFPRCPRCRLPLDREFVSFCDRCGQKLDWNSFPQIQAVYPG